jgi:hypothetical protein
MNLEVILCMPWKAVEDWLPGREDIPVVSKTIAALTVITTVLSPLRCLV